MAARAQVCATSQVTKTLCHNTAHCANTSIIARKNNIQMGIASNKTFEIKAIKQKQNITTVFDDERELDIAVKDLNIMFSWPSLPQHIKARE